jgi:hypothetical protein
VEFDVPSLVDGHEEADLRWASIFGGDDEGGPFRCSFWFVVDNVHRGEETTFVDNARRGEETTLMQVISMLQRRQTNTLLQVISMLQRV